MSARSASKNDYRRISGLATLDIYTDGGCFSNPGPGGWAAVIYDGPNPTEVSGFEGNTTNQRMELRAAVEALRGS